MKQFSLTANARDETGVVATLSRGEESTVEHFYGWGREAMRRVAEFYDAGGWRVVTLSTPTTIWRDLQGDRTTALDRKSTGFPEDYMLGTIGRHDLFDAPVVRRGQGHA